MSDVTWGAMLNRWHDELPTLHVLRENWSPLCGVWYYASSGPCSEKAPTRPKCKRCLGIINKRERCRQTKRG